MLSARLGLAAALLAGAAQVQPSRPASEILAEAQTAAAREHKTVFLIFQASW